MNKYGKAKQKSINIIDWIYYSAFAVITSSLYSRHLSFKKEEEQETE